MATLFNWNDCMPYIKKLFLFSIALFVVKLALLPFVHEVDADAISRTNLALQFANNPHIIESGNWPPLFFYLMGGALKLYPNQFFTPVFVNIALSIGLLFPLFFILKRIFEEKIAFLLCVFFSFSPIVFRMSLLGMSEIPYLFFVILSVSVLIKGLTEQKSVLILIAGFVMTIACGIRYESWLIGSFATGLILYRYSYKEALLFALPFIAMPIYWLSSNLLQTNDALNSFNWAIESSNLKSIKSTESFFRRIWWYPLSLVFAFGPFAFYFFIVEVKKTIQNRKSEKIKFILLLIIAVILVIWLINSLRGSLLLQHRFAITLFLFSFPFLGYYLKNTKRNPVTMTLLFSATAFLLAFVYSSKGARPIPRLLTNDAPKVSDIINENINPNSGLICDFWNWETTYYIPFSTGLAEDNVEIIETGDQRETIIDKITIVLNSCDEGVIMVNKSRLLKNVLIDQQNTFELEKRNVTLQLDAIYENESIICYKYRAEDL